jgi:hypothetical protein
MLLRISSSPPRLLARSSSAQICIIQQIRTIKEPPKLFRQPEVFHQSIVFSDGSSFQVMTSSPRKVYRLARDKYNNPLWTGRGRSSDDDEQDKRLAKFRSSYATTLGGTETLLSDGDEMLPGNAAQKQVEKIFSMLEAEDAYTPTRGYERKPKTESTEADKKKKKKGVRTA